MLKGLRSHSAIQTRNGHTIIQASDVQMLLTCVQIRVTTLTSVLFVILFFILSIIFILFYYENINVILSDSDIINGNLAPYFKSDFLEADKVIVLAMSLKAANFSLPISHNLTNNDNIPLKVAKPYHKLHVISNKELKCDSFS